MTENLYTVSMADKELGLSPQSFAGALRNRSVPPAARIGAIALFSQEQMDWLLMRENTGKGILQTFPFLWKTPWDGSNKQIIYMSTADVLRALDIDGQCFRRMRQAAELEPDAVAGRYRGYLPTSVAQWLGASHPEFLSPQVLSSLNRFGR